MVTGVDMAARWRVRKATCHHPQSLRTAIRPGRVVGTDVVQLRGGGTRGRGRTRPEERGSAMPPHTVITTMLGGLLGTVAQIMCVYGVVPLIAGPSLDGAALVGSPCALGLLLHLLSGSVLLPVGFLALPADAVPGPLVLRGMLWAGCLWLALETLVAPLLGAGVFSAALGGFSAALRVLLGYLVYGATVGGIAGAPAPEDRGTLGGL